MMNKFSFTFDAGFGYPKYLAHLTIGFGKRTLWLNIVTSNWNSIVFRPKKNRFEPLSGCFSVFTFAYTD
jgi:hypothetical protein